MENKLELKNINKIIGKRHIIKRYLWSIFAVFLLAASYNLFVLPNNLVTGGISGIAVITKDIIDPSTLILVANIILVTLSFMILGKEKSAGSLLGIIFYPLFIKLTANIGDIITFDNNDILLNVLFAGFISGIASGIVFKNGFSTGGTDIAAMIASKVFKKPIGKMVFIIDAIIILAGAYYLGIIKAMYAVVYLYIYSIMADKVMLGISDNKAFYIITNKEDEVKDFIFKSLNHGVTILRAKGGYEGHRENVLLCVVPSRQYFKLKEGINLIDEKAFFVVTDAYEVKGGA
jgi:uncharacterized membrane-anchored protein YitT (DUF2179 family)